MGKPRGQTTSRQSSCYTAAKDARTGSRSSIPPASISWQYPRSGEGQLSSPCPNPTSPRTTPITTAQSRFSAFHSRSWSDFSWPAWIPSLTPNYPTNKQASADNAAPSTRSWAEKWHRRKLRKTSQGGRCTGGPHRGLWHRLAPGSGPEAPPECPWPSPSTVPLYHPFQPYSFILATDRPAAHGASETESPKDQYWPPCSSTYTSATCPTQHQGSTDMRMTSPSYTRTETGRQ